MSENPMSCDKSKVEKKISIRLKIFFIQIFLNLRKN